MEVKPGLPGAAALLFSLYILLFILLNPAIPFRTTAVAAAATAASASAAEATEATATAASEATAASAASSADVSQDEVSAVDSYPDLRVSPPCPNADYIFPCTCMNYSTGRTYVYCDGITDEAFAYRALHTPGYGESPVASFSMTEGTVQTISNGLFDEHSFEMVFLSDNQIATFEAGTLEPLRYDLTGFYMDDNLITHHIVHQIVGFPTLFEFHMGNNLIEDISDMAEIEGIIPQLRVIDFAGNLLTEVPAQAFKCVPNIYMIILSDNLISYVNPEAFTGLQIVDYISLDGNNLNHLGTPEVGKVVVSRQIFRLDLARNEIDSLEPGFVEGLGDDSSLTLDSNPIKYFPEEVFGDLLRNMSISDYPWSYHGIDMYHNWLECGCDLLWVAIDGWLNAHLFGGHCGNKTLEYWEWESIDDIDVEELKEECIHTTTYEPPPPNTEDGIL